MSPGLVSSLQQVNHIFTPSGIVCIPSVPVRSGGQAVSWLLGVPGASACLLEAAVPYSMAACDEKLAAVHTSGYCSREVCELRENATLYGFFLPPFVNFQARVISVLFCFVPLVFVNFRRDSSTRGGSVLSMYWKHSKYSTIIR